MTKCNKSVYLANKSIDMIDAVNKGYADGYNKAIDDFADKIIILCIDGEFMNRFNELTATTILEIAEQLKAGEQNE